MKYLKKFESLFGPAEPKPITVGECSRINKSLGREFFSKSEMNTLINLMENSGRDHKEEEEWDELGWSEKIDFYRIGVSYLHFLNPTFGEDNPHPYEVFIQKCKDEWFLVSFYQEDYDGEEYHSGWEEYYECDGFECVLDLLKKNKAV